MSLVHDVCCSPLPAPSTLQERKSEDDPPGQYEGETALHIAVVNRDFDMVKGRRGGGGRMAGEVGQGLRTGQS